MIARDPGESNCPKWHGGFLSISPCRTIHEVQRPVGASRSILQWRVDEIGSPACKRKVTFVAPSRDDADCRPIHRVPRLPAEHAPSRLANTLVITKSPGSGHSRWIGDYLVSDSLHKMIVISSLSWGNCDVVSRQGISRPETEPSSLTASPLRPYFVSSLSLLSGHRRVDRTSGQLPQGGAWRGSERCGSFASMMEPDFRRNFIPSTMNAGRSSVLISGGPSELILIPRL